MDLLKKIGENCSTKDETVVEKKVELSLGLSSNGRFGVEVQRSNGQFDDELSTEVRTSLTLLYKPPAVLARTFSLPLETEEEWKKRKEMQTMRRLEAKRKRDEKIKNGKIRDENCEMKRNAAKRVSPPSSSSSLLLPPKPRLTVRSPASGGSSGVFDLEAQPFSGTNKDTELKNTNKGTEVKNTLTQQFIPLQQPVPLQITRSIPNRSTSIPSNPTASQPTNRNMSKHETLKKMFANMPCVTTKGDGVNGKKIEGFLYKYKKGEDVKIVCVCHGSFLTPAEFVKHGGGVDVEHPLKHIVVIPPAH
ncbi:hypothetical protein QVD17_18651 [Tagetes erecta]|uniref:Ninja-family protein n=1 Tax=Tagetes erecta TaxID=13708 RepID=A0AAD8KI07_TARER|nr:hypothetical protein QVD17_18651 [Tagetes erecta]